MPSLQEDPLLFSNELIHALDEQSFGIQEYTIIPNPFEHASIRLLEDEWINVMVSEKGWQVVLPSGASTQLTLPATAQRFATLNDLLRHSSRMYEVKETELLMLKLQAVFESRADDEPQE